MVKITLITSNPKEVDIVPETMTVREFLEKHDVNYGLSSTSIDGVPLANGGMDMSFMEHQIQDRAIVTCLPNKDNGAQAIVIGSSCVVKSALTPEEIKRVKKFHPEALVLSDEDGEPVKTEVEIAVQVNGKVRGRIMVPADLAKADAERDLPGTEAVQKLTAGKNIVKVVFVPGRLLNIVVK